MDISHNYKHTHTHTQTEMIIAATIVKKQTLTAIVDTTNALFDHTLKQYTTPFCLNYNSLVTWKNTILPSVFYCTYTHKQKVD